MSVAMFEMKSTANQGERLYSGYTVQKETKLLMLCSTAVFGFNNEEREKGEGVAVIDRFTLD